MALPRFVVCCVLTILTPRLVSAQPANVPASARPAGKPVPQAKSPPRPQVVSYGRNAAQVRIESVLEQQLRNPLSFVQAPINQIAEVLAEEYDIPIIFDTKALEAAGVTPDAEASVSIGNVSLKSALRLLLDSAADGSVAYILDNEVLLITSQEVANNHLERRIYPVKKLVTALESESSPAAGSETPNDNAITELARTLTHTVSPSTWRRDGNAVGGGDLQKLGDRYLVVLQTQAVHEEIELFLKHLTDATVIEAAIAAREEH